MSMEFLTLSAFLFVSFLSMLLTGIWCSYYVIYLYEHIIMHFVYGAKAMDTKDSGMKLHLWGILNLDRYAIKQIN